jgi:hypothetical protein
MGIEQQSGQPVVSRSNYLPPPADRAVLENAVAFAKPAQRKTVATKKNAKGDLT